MCLSIYLHISVSTVVAHMGLTPLRNNPLYATVNLVINTLVVGELSSVRPLLS